MKKLFTFLFVLPALILVSFSTKETSLTKEERVKATTMLVDTHKELLTQVKGLSEAQLNFKPSPEVWSVAECVEHIAISENNIFGIVGMTMKEDANPAKRAELKMSDEQIYGFITNRDQKVKTRPEFEPKKNYGSYEGSLDEYEAKRKENIKYVKKTEDDLRNHFFEFPFGLLDSYQVIVFMAGHTKRHTAQIVEVKAHADFPKN